MAEVPGVLLVDQAEISPVRLGPFNGRLELLDDGLPAGPGLHAIGYKLLHGTDVAPVDVGLELEVHALGLIEHERHGHSPDGENGPKHGDEGIERNARLLEHG